MIYCALAPNSLAQLERYIENNLDGDWDFLKRYQCGMENTVFVYKWRNIDISATSIYAR